MPRALREGALALGAPSGKWSPRGGAGGLRGILTGMILGVARIAGEGAPLLFTASAITSGLAGLHQPTASSGDDLNSRHLAYDDWHRQAWAAGLVLAGMVLITNIARPLDSVAQHIRCTKGKLMDSAARISRFRNRRQVLPPKCGQVRNAASASGAQAKISVKELNFFYGASRRCTISTSRSPEKRITA